MKKFVVICTLSLMFAFAAMSEAATEWVRLVTDDAKGYVVSSHGNSATIDVGTSMGSRVGGLFLVYSEGNPVYDASGVLLSVEKIPLGVLKVRQAAGNFSMCGFVPPTNPAVIRPGDKVVPIAANVLKSLKFALAHPVLEPVYTEGFISQVPVEAVPAAAFGVPAAVP
ncbi:MAG: hypothetical protein LBQ36_07940, partial [Synergistaceae bacterium]|nr:hypothetical protein [Synergistaceae bacterium]